MTASTKPATLPPELLARLTGVPQSPRGKMPAIRPLQAEAPAQAAPAQRPRREIHGTCEEIHDRVRRAREIYLDARALDPNDITGKVRRAEELYEQVCDWADRLTGALPLKRRETPTGPWQPPEGNPLRPMMGLVGLIPPLSETAVIDPQEEDVMIRRNWRRTMDAHAAGLRQWTLDRLATSIPREPGEAFVEYRARLLRRRRTWRPGADEELVNRRSSPSAPPRQGPSGSPRTRRTRTGPTGRTRAPRSSA